MRWTPLSGRAGGACVRRLAPAVALVMLLAGGCVERKLVIRSEPSANLILDGRQVGNTPFEEAFLHYGEREMTLSAPGYHRLRTTAAVGAPWYQRFPLDFVAEFLWPFTITDRQEFTYRLQPLAEIETIAAPETQRLLDRADTLRRSTHSFGVEK